MKKGWYRVGPYATAHYFANAEKSLCGIEARDIKKFRQDELICCQNCQSRTGGVR